MSRLIVLSAVVSKPGPRRSAPVAVAAGRLRFVLAQLGPKPGSRAALKRLLHIQELPGTGWKVIDQRTWRTGVGGGAPWQSRARAVGSITAWRSFEHQLISRYLWVQVTPLASPGDAAEAIAHIEGKALANLKFRGELTEQRPVAVPFQGDTASGVEQEVTTASGPSTALMLPVVIASTVLILGASGPDSARWTWSELVALAEAQAARLA